jgi:hypothetical protein
MTLPLSANSFPSLATLTGKPNEHEIARRHLTALLLQRADSSAEGFIVYARWHRRQARLSATSRTDGGVKLLARIRAQDNMGARRRMRISQD